MNNQGCQPSKAHRSVRPFAVGSAWMRGLGMSRVRRAVRFLPLLVLFAALVGSPIVGRADARTDYLVRLLESGSTFRVRTQAALSLARSQDKDAARNALIKALFDDHPAVRSAAASALGALRDPEALSSVRAAMSRERDRDVKSALSRTAKTLAALPASSGRRPAASSTSTDEEPQPTGEPRYYVGVGEPASSAPQVNAELRAKVQDFLRRRVGQVEGVVLAPSSESNPQATRALRRNRLTGYFISTNIVKVESKGSGTRAVVSIILQTYPGRDMRVILQGAATVQGAPAGSDVQQAVEGALTGALRRLPQAMQASDQRGG